MLNGVVPRTHWAEYSRYNEVHRHSFSNINVVIGSGGQRNIVDPRTRWLTFNPRAMVASSGELVSCWKFEPALRVVFGEMFIELMVQISKFT